MGYLTVTRSPALVRYVVAQNVTITVSVYNDSDVLTDPSNGVELTVTHPVGVDTTPTLTHGSTGVYTATVTLDEAGRWIFHAQSDGDIVAAERLTLAVEDTGISEIPADEEVVLMPLDAEEGSHPYKGQTAWEQRRFAIEPDIDLTGVSDASSEIARCFALREGAWLYTGDGSIRMNSGVSIPRGCAFTGRPNGMNFGPFQYAQVDNVGTMFKMYGTGKLFTMEEQSTLEGVQIYYPNQASNATPTSYDYAIYCADGHHGPTILDVVALNAYKLMFIGVNGATVDMIQGQPLSRGIDLGRCAEVVRISRVLFNNGGVFGSAIAGATLIAWMQANLVNFSVDGAEAFSFHECFAGGGLMGLDFADNDTDNATSYGKWSGGGIEGCKTSVRVAADTGLATLNISDCAFVGGDAAGHIVDFLDSGASTDKPRIFATNWHCWGSSDAIVNFASTSNGRFIHHGGAVFGYTGTAYRTNATANMNVLRLSHVGSQTTSRTNGAGDIHDVGAWPT